MLIEKARVKIADLKEKKDFPFAPLEAVGPNLSGWGVVETSLLLPQSVCLMIGPLACLRHSAFMAQARKFYDRFYMLPLEEMDIVLGKHIPKVKAAMVEITKRESPKILLLSGTCCDHILGTEYKEAIKEIKEEKVFISHNWDLVRKVMWDFAGIVRSLKMLEFATSTSYEVVGKPSNSFYAEALKKLQLQTDTKITFQDITMISDDVKGDLGGAKQLGMKTIFVTSGKYKTSQEIVPFLDESKKPDFVYANMQEILEKI